MNKPILLKNALLIDPKNEREFIGSILTRDGNICEIFNTPDPNYSISDCEIIDCNNNTLSPGLIDMWVFVGEPGYEHCLLYTSPSPRDATLSRMPSSA